LSIVNSVNVDKSGILKQLRDYRNLRSAVGRRISSPDVSLVFEGAVIPIDAPPPQLGPGFAVWRLDRAMWIFPETTRETPFGDAMPAIAAGLSESHGSCLHICYDDRIGLRGAVLYRRVSRHGSSATGTSGGCRWTVGDIPPPTRRGCARTTSIPRRSTRPCRMRSRWAWRRLVFLAGESA
jgi:hypothetical protein